MVKIFLIVLAIFLFLDQINVVIIFIFTQFKLSGEV